ncbi:segregation/condensation protein A [Polymorphobacter multimanifer]|uniref:Segregation and condensation protein A n=1 Tax=Polymorphobacter multimanifer TaxID=1070431 RepID=A0A841LE02_9SPHN|nr:ScpA family protein [Polymorphobacter multimanifer]MBB6227392.1 segregation and condensation protein A [Polymorphobacter multimanifer]GGI89274.1 segregation/condensation protein A [Polymorphobacter multimanifer]
MTEPFEDGPPRAEAPPSLVLQLGSWEGPLDLLLQLARTQKVDLAQISILALVEQYLAFIRDARALSLELAADYLVMAAWLAYLKSALLLPPEPDADPDPAEMALKLQFQLQRLGAMRDAGQKLLARPQLGWDSFRRAAPEGLSTETLSRFDTSLFDLISAYGNIQARAQHGVHVVRRRPVMALDEAIERLERLLGASLDWAELVRYLPRDLADESYARSVLASSFVATLELVRQGRAEVSQGAAFAPILIRGRA